LPVINPQSRSRPEHSRRRCALISSAKSRIFWSRTAAGRITGALLPFNSVQTVKVSPGEQLSAVGNDGVADSLVVVEDQNKKVTDLKALLINNDAAARKNFSFNHF
jgi:hypothetical protein